MYKNEVLERLVNFTMVDLNTTLKRGYESLTTCRQTIMVVQIHKIKAATEKEKELMLYMHYIKDFKLAK